MTELKPCPFCGGAAKFFVKASTDWGITRGWKFGIYCAKCNITTPKTDYSLEIQMNDKGDIITTVDERPFAVEAWNRRTHDR